MAYFQVEAPDTVIDGDLWMDIDDVVGEIKFHGFEPFETINGYNEYSKKPLDEFNRKHTIYFNVNDVTDVSPKSFGSIFGGTSGSEYRGNPTFAYFFPARPVFSNEIKIEVYASEEHADLNITSHVYNIIF